MAVYVDEAIHEYGRMVMCHMMADSTDELLEMAKKIGVQRKWMQSPGTAREHFDICKTKRALAVASGAIEVTARELAKMTIQRRHDAEADHTNRAILDAKMEEFDG